MSEEKTQQLRAITYFLLGIVGGILFAMCWIGISNQIKIKKLTQIM